MEEKKKVSYSWCFKGNTRFVMIPRHYVKQRKLIEKKVKLNSIFIDRNYSLNIACLLFVLVKS